MGHAVAGLVFSPLRDSLFALAENQITVISAWSER